MSVGLHPIRSCPRCSNDLWCAEAEREKAEELELDEMQRAEEARKPLPPIEATGYRASAQVGWDATGRVYDERSADPMWSDARD